MTKKLLFSLLVLFVASNLYSLEVDEKEIKSTSNTTIEFINYTGPHKVIDSLDAIKGIGKSLGNEIAPNR